MNFTTPLTVSLSDQTPVLLRTVGPEDRDAVIEAFRRLSVQSRYYRFWTPYKKLPDSILQRFLHSDQHDHQVWAAQDPDFPMEPGYGAASWWRDKKISTLAEVSITVADDARRKGIGTLLLAIIWISAQRAGIREFIAYVLPENQAVTQWFTSLGAQMNSISGQYTLRLTLDAKKLPDNAPANKLKVWIERLEFKTE